MGAPEIVPADSLKTDYPANFAKDRQGFLYITNGLNRGYIWDSFSETAFRLGILEPETPAVTDDTGGGSVPASSTFQCALKYVDIYGRESALSEEYSITTSGASNHRLDWAFSASDETDRVQFVDLWRTTAGQSTTYYKVARLGNHGAISATEDNGSGFCRFTVPFRHHLLDGARIVISGHSVAGYNTQHNVTVVDVTQFDTDIAFSSAGTGTADWVIVGYYNEDDVADATLDDNESLPITNPDGTINARRQGPPPSECAVAVWFQDRMFYGVQRKYTQGTVTTTAGSAAITGTGTEWMKEFGGTDSFPAHAGEWMMQIEGEPRPIRIAYYDPAFSPDNEMTADETTIPTLTQSGASYTLYPDTALFRSTLIYSEVDEGESVPYDEELGYVNTITIQENTGDDDELTALMPYGYALWAIKERHIYRLMFAKQPDIEAGVVLVASRGCLNQRCWTYHEGLAYLMDMSGAYSFDGNNPDPISLPIQNYWRNGTIDFTNSKWFFVAVDSAHEVVKFYVQFTGDAGDRPTRALCYHTRGKAWTMETYPWGIGGACKADLGTSERLLVGAEDDAIYATNEGFTDAGTAISVAWRGGKFSFSGNGTQQSRAFEVAFQPTEAAATLNASYYLDNNASPVTRKMDNKAGNGIICAAGSSDFAINMLRTRSPQGDQAGFVRQEFGGRTDKGSPVNRWVSLQLTATAPTNEQIIVHAVKLDGVQGG